MTTQEYNTFIESRGIRRRDFGQAIAIFLGSSILPLGCQSNSNLPPPLQKYDAELTDFQHTWSPAPAVVQLGQEVIKVTGNIQELLTQFLDTLSQQPQDLLKDKQQLANKLKELHLVAARRHSWVEVKGWRLTSVEGAIYALCTFEVQ